MAAKAGAGGSMCRSGWVAVFMLLVWVLVATASANATPLPTTISSNMTLTSTGSPYTGTNVTVASGASLTIEAGSVVKITGRLRVNGVLRVNGTAASPVTFTSKKDDSVGGDTNGDGGATVPKPGDWLGILFTTSTESIASRLDHADVLYGGASSTPTVEIICPCDNPPEISQSRVAHGPYQAIYVSKGAPLITYSRIEDNGGAGIRSASASPRIHDNTITGNTIGINFSVSSGEHASVDINNNLVEGNSSTGISVNASIGADHIDSASMGNNLVKGNGGKAINYQGSPNNSESPEYVGTPIPPNITTNTLSGNKENGIWVSGRIAESTTWEASGYSLVVFFNGLNVGKGSTLTLRGGSVVKNEGRRIYVNGALNSEGTPEVPITFTSVRDDTVGGDTNGDRTATTPAPGDWQTIEYPGSANGLVLTHTRVLYGGQSVYPYDSMIEIHCPCVSQPEFASSLIANSYESGIDIHGGAPSITSSTIEGNAASGIKATSASPHIQGNTIAGNGTGINFSVSSGEHASVDINNNLVEGNSSTGISVSASIGADHIDSASMGNNLVKGNGGKAINYQGSPNNSESPEYVGTPIPPNITTNTLSGNKENGIWVSGRIAESTTWEAAGYPLVVFNNGLNIGRGAILTLQAGTVVKGEGGSVEVNGAVHPAGNAEAPVVFTSVKDDTVTGDSNGDGTASVPAPGDWGAIKYPDSKDVELEFLDLRYAEIAFDIQYLDSLVVANSDFVFNEKAFEVAETANNSPELGALSCVPPYLSFVISAGNWYGSTGLPSPDADISGAVGAALPEEYESLFGAAASLGEATFSLYGGDNTIPWSIYSCPALGIPPTPVTPVIIPSVPPFPLFPDPQVE